MTGKLLSVLVIMREPLMDPSKEWAVRLSSDVTDWYSPLPSGRFNKTLLNVSATVFLDATEFGDVLMTAGLDVGQVRSGCWAGVVLGCWAAGLLGCWAAELLGC